MSCRIGIDTGGTFTDLVILDESGQFRSYKAPTTPKDYSIGILDCLRQCAEDYSLSLEELAIQMDPLLVHGSTIATNTVIEGKGAKTGLLVTMGQKSVLWKREGNKIDIFNHYEPWPEPLVPVYLTLEAKERINSEGEILVPLDEESVRAAINQFKKWNVEAIGVCLLWSIVNDRHERRIAQILEEEWPGIPYSLSSDVQPIVREFHRTSMVAFDAMLKPIMTRYVDYLTNNFRKHKFQRDFLMVVSSGGIMTAGEVNKKPVYTLFSGPAMGPSAGLVFSKHAAVDNCVVIDMGGTSFDVSAIVDSVPTMTREAKVGDDPTGVTSVDVLTLGAGGGSIAWVDKGGLLHVGPRSAGAEPGPACYNKGGQDPTVTDANVVLGYINPDYFLGGKMKIYPELSYEVIEEKVAKPLKQDVKTAASGIYRVVNENMIGGILNMTVRRGIDPREFLLVCGGGAGAIHAVQMAKELDMRKMIVPKTASVLCAFGMLNADITFSMVGSKYTDTDKFDFEGVNTMLAELENKAKQALDREGIPENLLRFDYYVAARYYEEPFTLDIPLRQPRTSPAMMAPFIEDFHLIHERRYGTRDLESRIEFTDWRVVGVGVMPKIELQKQSLSGPDASPALKGKRLAYFEEKGGFVETPIYDGNKLIYGMSLFGPAIIEDVLTTTVAIPNSRVTVNEFSSYIIELV